KPAWKKHRPACTGVRVSRKPHPEGCLRKEEDMTSLNDAVVLVTGSNTGLGAEFVKAAVERGARRVYATARKPKEWGDERVVPLQLDVADPGSVDRALAQAGDTTVLVNNAAIFPRGDLLTGPFEDITAIIETNLIGPIRLARAFAPALRAAG